MKPHHSSIEISGIQPLDKIYEIFNRAIQLLELYRQNLVIKCQLSKNCVRSVHSQDIGFQYPIFGFNVRIFTQDSNLLMRTLNYWHTNAIYLKILWAQIIFQLSYLKSKVWIKTSIWETNLRTRKTLIGCHVDFFLQCTWS